MLKIQDKSKCTGCTACESVCGRKAISMIYDEFGHLYPSVDMNLCVECGLCEKTCPVLHKNEIERNTGDITVYAAYNNNLEVRSKSTSGGIFSVLAEEIISEGGLVFAARFDDDFNVIHDCFDNVEKIGLYRGSKYAQSNLHGIFKSIKEHLKNRSILFVGTPCQVEGLLKYLHKDYPNLITCDFICMCIASPKMWKDYLNEYHSNSTIEAITFKDKRNSWHKWNMLIKDAEGEHLMRGTENPFFNSYLQHYSARPSCFSCPFRKIYRNSDITIADCWGIDKVQPSFDDDKGCTTMILQSKKGVNLFQKIKKQLCYLNYDINDVILYNPYINRPITQPANYVDFNMVYSKKGFREAVNIIGTKKALFDRLFYVINKLFPH